MPAVSIIMPCFNSERHLTETLESVFAQTMGDFELICIDNESTDDTPLMLNSWAREHDNMKVLAHAGFAARNVGIEAASGEWLCFIDSDDIAAPTMLEESLNCARGADAEVVVFKVEELDDQTGEVRPADYAFDVSWLDEGATSFNPQEHAQRLFNSFQNWPCNKLFRTDFIRARAIEFQDIRRTEDLVFTCRALSEARRIALLPRFLYRYRVNNPHSNLQTSDQSSTDFILAFAKLKEHLDANGTWQLYRDSFVNWAMNGITFNLYLSRTYDGFAAIVDMLKGGYLESLGIADYPRERAFDARHWDDCSIVLNDSHAEIAFRYLQLEKGSSNDARNRASRARQEASALRDQLIEAQSLLAQAEEELARVAEQPKRGGLLRKRR